MRQRPETMSSLVVHRPSDKPTRGYDHLMTATFPFTLSPAVSVMIYKYIPLATGSPLSFFRSQSTFGPSVCSSVTLCPDTVNSFTVVPTVTPLNVRGRTPCLSDRHGFGYTLKLDKLALTK